MKKLFILSFLLLSFFVVTPHAHAAIALDATSSIAQTTASTTLTWTHTIGAGSNMGLMVAVYGGCQTTTGVTYNTVAMTQITNVNIAQTSFQSAWYLPAPASGAHSIVATFSASNCNSVGEAVSYSGIQQGTSADAFATSTTGSGTSFSLNLTTVTNNDWTVGMFNSNQGAAPASSAGITTRLTTAGGTNPSTLMGDNGPITPAGSTTSTVTGSAGFWQGIIVALAPAAAASSPTKRRQPIILLRYDPLATFS